MGSINTCCDASTGTCLSVGLDTVTPNPDLLPVDNPGESFWHSEPHEFHNYRTKEFPTESDIIIIGAGYAGVSTAYHLTKNQGSIGKQITILEARGVCSGATGRNGGHLRPDLYGHIPIYLKRAGSEAAAELAEFEISHVQAIKKVVEKEEIACDFTLTRTIDVWCNEKAATNAKEIYDDMKSRFKFMEDVVFYSDKNVQGICGVRHAKACASYTAGTIWPYKFIMHFVKSFIDEKTVNIQTNTAVTSVTIPPDGRGYIIHTSRGSIRAKQVIHANNAYVSGLLPEYKKAIVPCKGICCRITVPNGNIAPLMTNSYINRDEKDVLSYLIPRPDGSIIVGGAAAKFKENQGEWYNNVDDSILIDSAKSFYDGYMQRTYPCWENSSAKVDRIWTGIMGYSYDSNPHVGAVPQRPGQFIIAGWNGHGMPAIWRSGEELAKMIAQKVPFEDTSMPRLFKTTQSRIERAQNSKKGTGDIIEWNAPDLQYQGHK